MKEIKWNYSENEHTWVIDECQPGEPFEQKLDRINDGNEPIGFVDNVVFDENIGADGSIYDIRRDKWQEAVETKEYIEAGYLAMKNMTDEEKALTENSYLKVE